MGFEAPGTGKILTFAGTPYEGLEVTVDSAPLSLTLEVLGNYQAYLALASGNTPVAEAAPLLLRMLDAFGAVLEAWNVTRRGKPVPATAEGLRSLDMTFAMAIIGAWLTGSVAADEDLGKGLPSGGTSPEALAAMAALSSSPRSSEPQKLLSACATAGTSCRARFSLSPPGCCGCSTFTGWATATRNRREVSRWPITMYR